MSTLYLLNYNNYYNRIVKREPMLSGYQTYLSRWLDETTDVNGNSSVVQNVNFIDGDFVDTQQVVNWLGDIPDYVLVVEGSQGIASRWFVVNAEKTRGGQLLLTLHRDLVADYLDNLLSDQTAIFVEKAILPPSNDLIFNSEDMSFNRIKTRETLLKDDTQCPWIVLYVARKNGEGAVTTFDSSFSMDAPYLVPTEDEYQDLRQYSNSAAGIYDTPFSTIITLNEALNGKTERSIITLNSQYTTPTQSYTSLGVTTGAALESNALSIVKPLSQNMLTAAEGLATAYISNIKPDIWQLIRQYKDKIIRHTPTGETTPHYYRVATYDERIDIVPVRTYTGALEQSLSPLKSAYTNPNQVTFGNLASSSITVYYQAAHIGVKLIEVPAPTDGNKYTINISDNRYHLHDAPYDMLCMPLSDSLLIRNSQTTPFQIIQSNAALNLNLANQLIADYSGAGLLYDAQILPYCPILTRQISTDSAGNIVYDINDVNSDAYSVLKAPDGILAVGYVLHATHSSFATTVDLEAPIVVTDYKVDNECDMYRLNAPNYSSSFEFSAAMNDGVSTINVKCTYKPFNPYIKLYPDFKRLYGNDYNDARGLICGGDFSLPLLTDQWKTYELSNKNYQAAFDRQIQNIEVNNSVQKEREIWSVASGVLSAGVQGATSGGLAAGPVGAMIGGVFGAGASIAGGIRDIQLNDKLRQETIDYAKDQFGYQLGNIKALPQTLTHTSAYNIDNKYFPFLEFYTCTQQEKTALRLKIAYNGMTVMQIGTLKYYVDNYDGAVGTMYFKGKLIRLHNFTGDYHILNAIAEEIYKGVFI